LISDFNRLLRSTLTPIQGEKEGGTRKGKKWTCGTLWGGTRAYLSNYARSPMWKDLKIEGMRGLDKKTKKGIRLVLGWGKIPFSTQQRWKAGVDQSSPRKLSGG